MKKVDFMVLLHSDPFFVLKFIACSKQNWTFGRVVKDIAVGSEGLGLDYRAGRIGHSVANGSSPLQRFFGAVLLWP